MTPIDAYRVTQPDGKRFYVVMVEDNGVVSVLSDVAGMFLPENRFHYADLLMPEHELNEWDVQQLHGDEAQAVFARLEKANG